MQDSGVRLRALPAQHHHEAREDVGLARSFGGKNRRIEFPEAPNRIHHEGQLVRLFFEARGRGQDHIRVAGRFVDVDVEGHVKVEFPEGCIESVAIRIGSNRIRGDGDRGPHLTLTRCLHLIRQARRGKFAVHFRMTVHPTLPTPCPVAAPARFSILDRRRDR